MSANSWGDWVKHHQTGLFLAVILLISLFLRFYDLGTESVWLDEAASIKESALSIQGIADHSNQPPLYFLLLRGWINLFGLSETSIRSLSAVFGVLAVLFIFLAGKALLNPRVGLIGAFLASFAYFPVAYSQEARSYSLLLMLSALSFWIFIEIMRTDKKWLYPVYLVTGLLLIYTHFYGLFIIISQVLYFIIFFKKYKSQRWKFMASTAALVIALIPFVLLLKNRISNIYGDGFWLPRPGLMTLVNTPAGFFGTGSLRYVNLALIILLAILGFFTIKTVQNKFTRTKGEKYRNNPVRQIHPESRETIVLLLLWAGISILVPFIESQFMTPVYQAKYAIGAFPAFCLLAANGLNNIKWQWVFYPVLILIVVLSSLGLRDYYRYDIKEQWREVARMIDSKAQSEDIIVVCEGYYATPLNYYYKGNLQEKGINNLEEAQKFVSSETDNMSKNQSKLWLVLVDNKGQILDYFLKSYGKDSVKLAKRYVSITVLQFDIAVSAQ
jgi:mannosyltransferase